METKNILLLGSGGRENALAWKIKQSPKLGKLYIAPGNAGTALCGTNVNIKATDFVSIKTFVLDNHIDMVIVGPEDPLVKGIYDYFKNDDSIKHIPVIGPSCKGAQLEGSKDFAKAFMMRHHIPTASTTLYAGIYTPSATNIFVTASFAFAYFIASANEVAAFDQLEPSFVPVALAST